mgnify:CR=1 FL=1
MVERRGFGGGNYGGDRWGDRNTNNNNNNSNDDWFNTGSNWDLKNVFSM